jgi:hypothetical protein
MIEHIIFQNLSDGAMATPCEQNINGMGMGYSFKVGEFEAADLNAGEFGYQYRETKDDLDIVHPKGKIEKAKGKVVKLSKAKMKKIVEQRDFLRTQKAALAQAKYAIKTAIINNVGSVTDQLNATSTTDETIKQEWQAKFALRDAIKFEHGKRLKDAIRTATKVEELPEITNDFESWANGG